MDGPNDRLDRAMEERRLDLDLSWNDVASEAKLSPATLRAIRRGNSQPEPLTKRRIEKVLRWASGSIDAIYASGEPTPLDEPASNEPSVAELADRLAALEAEFKRIVGDREDQGKAG